MAIKRNLDEAKLLHLSTPAEWRRWLQRHYQTEPEAWLVYPKAHSGKPRVAYNDAVEQALCFGWVDSTVRSLDADHFAQRFSPRKPGSAYSQANKERLRGLARESKIIPEVLSTLKPVLDEAFEMPADILEALRADPQAWKNFQAFSEAYVRIRIAFIEGARKRPAEFEKRLRYFIEMTAKNKMFGFGGIEKYY